MCVRVRTYKSHMSINDIDTTISKPSEYCRRHGCENKHIPYHACCSKECRLLVPTCDIDKCLNAVEKLYKYDGTEDGYTQQCFGHLRKNK